MISGYQCKCMRFKAERLPRTIIPNYNVEATNFLVPCFIMKITDEMYRLYISTPQ